MTLAILGIVAAIIPIAWFLIKRWMERKQDPAQRHDKINQAIVEGDSTTVNVHLDDALKRLHPNPDGGNPTGQTGNTNACGTTVHAHE